LLLPPGKYKRALGAEAIPLFSKLLWCLICFIVILQEPCNRNWNTEFSGGLGREFTSAWIWNVRLAQLLVIFL